MQFLRRQRQAYFLSCVHGKAARSLTYFPIEVGFRPARLDDLQQHDYRGVKV